MSFWDNIKNIAKPYADEDEYEDEYDEEGTDGYEEEVEERPSRSRRSPFSVSTGSDSEYSAPERSTGFSGSVVGMSGKQEVVLFHPANFNDTSKAADDLRSKKAVIVNMENVDKAMARRVVDFLSGCAYALDGKIKKIAISTYIITPYNVDIVGDLIDELENSGLYL